MTPRPLMGHGLTIPVITRGGGALTVLPGRATVQEAAVHLIPSGAFVLLAVNR